MSGCLRNCRPDNPVYAITSDLRSKAYVSEEEAKKANAEVYRLQKQLEQHKRLLDGIPPELLKQLKNIKERGR